MTTVPERRRHTFPRALSLQNRTWYRNVYHDSDQSDEETSGFEDKSIPAGVSPRRMNTFCITGESVFRAVSYPSEDVPLSGITQPINRSLQIGRPRPVAMGLKDVNLANNEQAEYFRLAREANKSPKKSNKHTSTPLRQVSCPEAMQLEFEITSKKERRNILGFHGDEDSGIVVTERCNSETNKTEQQAEDNNVTLDSSFSAFQLCKWTLSVFILIIGVGLYVHVNPHSMCLHGEFQANLSGFEQELKEKFYGQHLAKRILESSLKSHLNKPKRTGKPLVFSLHGWTGIGKNFVSGIIADHLFKHGSQSPFVHKIIVPHHFAHEGNAELYEKQLISWIQGNVSKCSTRALFIFDEMDKMPSRLVKTIKTVLSHRGTLAGVDYSNVIFLFLSNSGGHMINNHVLNQYHKGRKREQIELRDLELVLRESVNSVNTWYHELLTSELIDHLVPFLPLERSHVKQCIKNELIQKGHPVLESLVSEIADQLSYFPPDLQLFSKSGCKKVSSRVDVATA